MIRLLNGDCLERMGEIADGTVDLVLADLPYGTTACRWDAVIALGPLWAHYRRIIKPRGAIVLTACEPFTSALVMSQPRWFRYRWVWDKVNRPTGFLNAKKRPLRIAEDIVVFAQGYTTFNPQMGKGKSYRVSSTGACSQVYGTHLPLISGAYGEQRYPLDILRLKADRRGTEGRIHPTQKPVELGEYLIRTYTNEGELVLDNVMGSGSFGVAAVATGRSFIGIERDPTYFAAARRRIRQAQRAARARVAS